METPILQQHINTGGSTLAKLTSLVPEEDSTRWAQPDPENFPEVEFEIKVVEAKSLDIISGRSKVKYVRRNSKGKNEEVEEFSNEKASKVYGELVFVDFKGIEDDDGKPLENTVETRQHILRMSSSFLNFVVDFAHSESNFVSKEKKKAEKRFLKNSSPSSKSTSDHTQAV